MIKIAILKHVPDFAFVPVITISGNITIKVNFNSDSVEYLDDELHVRDRKMNEYAHVMRYLGLLGADVEGADCICVGICIFK